MYPIRLLDQLESIGGKPWEGIVWRHMFGDTPPSRENASGARWNPRDVPAIYTSLERSVAIAEGDYLISIQPVRPSARRVLYTVKVRLHNVITCATGSSSLISASARRSLGPQTTQRAVR
jgi:hypothetical protein